MIGLTHNVNNDSWVDWIYKIFPLISIDFRLFSPVTFFYTTAVRRKFAQINETLLML